MVSQSKRIWKCGATTQYNKIGYDPIYSTHFVVVGVGFAFVACSDGCGKQRTMRFAKVCLGLAVGISGSAGYVAGLEGSKCVPDTDSGLFDELGAGIGYLGGSLDVGDGVIEAGATVGGGAQAGVCYYIYVGDSN